MITYFNIVENDGLLTKPVETWGLFKRNASSYIHDLANSDQSNWPVKLLPTTHYPTHGHDFQHFIPSPGTLQNHSWSLSANPSNMKICVRDPLHRYCSGLVMIQWDVEQQYNRSSTMSPYFHNGGREEIINIVGARTERDIRYLFCWRDFVRMISNTVYQQHNAHSKDFTFGESHLDPTLSLALLLPFLHKAMVVDFVDLRRWTEYTTQRLGIAESVDAVHKWNTPKLENRRDKISPIGQDMFTILKQELPFFSKNAMAYKAPQNWQPTFEDWIQFESDAYNFIRQNPQIRNTPNCDQHTETKNKCIDFLIQQLEDPYFLARSEIVRRNFCDPYILEVLPKPLTAAITNCCNKLLDYDMGLSHKRQQSD